jgi:hypothetical protein
VARAQALRAGLLLLGWPDVTQTPPAGWQEWPSLTARLLGSLAATEMAQGNSDLSFNLLNSAESLVPLEDRAILLQPYVLPGNGIRLIVSGMFW